MSKNNRMLIIFLIVTIFTGACQAALPVDEEADFAAGQVMVTNVTVNPAVLMMDDIATVTITIKNNGDTPVPISTADLYSNDLRVVNDKTYGSVGTLGAGNTMSLTFTIEANARDDIYYLWFYLDFRDSGSLKSHIPITIESTPILVSVIDAPEVFQTGAKQEVTVLVANPRDNAVNGVNVVPGGEGIETTQSVGFIGNLAPDSSKEVTFDVTAYHPASFLCTASYRNGINEHFAETTIPIKTGEGKIRAEVIVNNIEIAGTAGRYTLTGDVNNAGLENAYATVVTIDDPGVPTDPYRSYIVGSLEPDDFSSFELTFSSKVNTIPLLITYKDQYGNDYSKEVSLNLNEIQGGAGFDGSSSSSGESMAAPQGGSQRGPGGIGSFGNGMKNLPVVEIGVGIVLLLLGIIGILFVRRSRLKKKRMKLIEQQSG